MTKKRRILRPFIEKTLITIAIILFLFLVMIDDFELSAIPVILGLWALLGCICLVLRKYGRGLWMEPEYRRETCLTDVDNAITSSMNH